jgi:hypothetical protein
MKYWGMAGVVLLGVIGVCPSASGEWRQAFRTASDSKIHAFQSDDAAPGRLVIGVEGGILESRDEGRAWRRVLTVPAGLPVNVLRSGDSDGVWWAATPKSIYRSGDCGRRWEPVTHFADPGNPVRCFLSAGAVLYAGRLAGLEFSRDGGVSWSRVPQLGEQEIHQIEIGPSEQIWVSGSGGIFRGSAGGGWECVYRRLSLSDAEPESSAAAPEAELAERPSPDPVHFWFDGADGVGLIDGLKRFRLHTVGGEVRADGILPSKLRTAPSAVNGAAGDAALALEGGIYLSDADGGVLKELRAGWPGSLPRSLVYEAAADRLVAVTDGGVFKYDHPDLGSFLESRRMEDPQKIRALTASFSHEPGILELQEAAMRYAEVHPDKIATWRRQAARRAWFPTLSVGQDRGLDQTVDIDRGGTGDADRFIEGPAEEDRQWSVDLSWDLGDLVWSTDQTTIDNRSKLMVQLRDELLSQLNQLYFARRRLQIAGMVDGGSEMQKELDRTLQIEEYTAGLDALTGGYFSRALGGRPILKVRSEVA